MPSEREAAPPMTSAPDAEPVPSRLHIGLQRAGSTYLYELLASHPDVALVRKGVSFYATSFERGLEWYQTLFPPRGIRIDSSPDYFFRGRIVAPRIKAATARTSPRFVLLLRNPIDYTASRFLLHRRTKGLRKRFGATPRDLEALVRDHPEYLDESRYAGLLEQHWFAHFQPTQFCIVLFEDFVADPPAATEVVLRFFGLRPYPLSAPPSSRNATLRHPFLHAVKRAIVRRPGLRAAMRGNPLVQRAYDRLLVGRVEKLTVTQRAWLRDLLAADVARLKRLLANSFAPWRDFQ